MQASQTDLDRAVSWNNVVLIGMATVVFTACLAAVWTLFASTGYNMGVHLIGAGVLLAGLAQMLIFGLFLPDRGETGYVQNAYFASRIYLAGLGMAEMVLGLALMTVVLFNIPALPWGLATWAIAAVGFANILRAQFASFGSGERTVYASLALVFGSLLTLVAGAGPLFKIPL